MGTELDNLLITNLASKMAAKLSFQSNLEFTGFYCLSNDVSGFFCINEYEVSHFMTIRVLQINLRRTCWWEPTRNFNSFNTQKYTY